MEKFHINSDLHLLMKKHKHFDLAIIGGGIAGLGALYFAKHIGLKVILIDKSLAGSGASSQNAGFITMGSLVHLNHTLKNVGENRFKNLLNFGVENLELSFKLFEEISYEKFSRHGSFTQTNEVESIDFIQNLLPGSYKVMKQVDHPLGVGHWLKGEGSVESSHFIPFLREHLFDESILENHEVLEVEEGKVFLENDIIHASHILITTNNDFVKSGLNLPAIIPQRAQIQRISFDGDFNIEGNHYIPNDRVYFRKSGSELLVGGLRLLDPRAEQTAVAEVNKKIQDALSKYISEKLAIKVLSQKSWSGIMAMSENELPVYRHSGKIHFLGGFSGHGMGFALLGAKRVVHGIANKRSIELPF